MHLTTKAGTLIHFPCSVRLILVPSDQLNVEYLLYLKYFLHNFTQLKNNYLLIHFSKKYIIIIIIIIILYTIIFFYFLITIYIFNS